MILKDNICLSKTWFSIGILKNDTFLKPPPRFDKFCWNLKWFQENLSKRGGGFKKSVIFQNAKRKSSFWKTYFVFQNRYFLLNFWKMTLFLKPPTKMKSHYITVILMQKIDDFLWKIRVFRSKLRHDCSNFFWKTCFSHKVHQKSAEIVFFVSGFKPKNGPM